MKKFLCLILALFCVNAAAQTIRSLGYNSTNGQIVAATNVVWTNAFNFSTNTVTAQVRTNLGLGWSALINSNAATELLAFTTNVTGSFVVYDRGGAYPLEFTNSSGLVAEQLISGNIKIATNKIIFSGTNSGFAFSAFGSAAQLRNDLSIPLAALTNNSNVTMMRALSGSTNTNHPFSGTVSVVGTNNTNTLVFSNGILQEVQ